MNIRIGSYPSRGIVQRFCRTLLVSCGIMLTTTPMSTAGERIDIIDYPAFVRTEMRDVVRRALQQIAESGLPGDHHAYIQFQTRAKGVQLSTPLMRKFPRNMTIVLQHEFEALTVDEDAFSVDLWFSGKRERLTVPFEAITLFADPSVNFRISFDEETASNAKLSDPTIIDKK